MGKRNNTKIRNKICKNIINLIIVILLINCSKINQCPRIIDLSDNKFKINISDKKITNVKKIKNLKKIKKSLENEKI